MILNQLIQMRILDIPKNFIEHGINGLFANFFSIAFEFVFGEVAMFFIGKTDINDADAGLALRSGHLCAQPLLRSLSLSACLRASFCLANTQADADALLAAIPSILALFP